jgi:hypothetical protein
MNRIINSDCIEGMKQLEAGSVDCCVTLSDYERGYLEALIDGEGSLSLIFAKQVTSPRPRVDIRISITNINREILDKVKGIVGGGNISRKTPKGNRKPVYCYQASPTIIRWLLPQLNLIVKREQKQIILEALSMLTGVGGRRKNGGGGLMRPLWKDQRFAELKHRLNELNCRGNTKAESTLLIHTRYEE